MANAHVGKETTTEADQVAETQRRERGERTAANIRYGQAISEGGMGGKTEGNDGVAESEGACGLRVSARAARR